MIIKYVAEIEGNIVSSKHTTFQIRGFTGNLHFTESDGQRALTAISIQRELTQDEFDEFTNKFEERPDGTHHLLISGYEEFHNDAMNVLQTLESFLGLRGIDRIHWNEATTEFIPETEEEQAQVATTEFDFTKSYPIRPKAWEFDFSSYDWEEIERLKVPLAFYRRGMNRFKRFDYISAFIEYYFVLEGLFAKGDWRKVEERLVESDELTSIAATTLEQLDEKIDELDEFFEFYNKERTPEGYLRLIVTLRHQLHHYFYEDESGPHEPNPFASEDYQPIAVTLSHTVFLLLLTRTEGIEYGNS